MKKLNYTHESRVWIFEQFMKATGDTWSPDWKWSRPKNWTTAQYNAVTLDIHRKYERKFPDLVHTFLTKADIASGKSGAIEQQLQWTITPQANSGKMTRRLRLAAYEAGFLMMSDIILLEQIQRFNVRSK